MTQRGITSITSILIGCIVLAACGLGGGQPGPASAPPATTAPATDTASPAPTGTPIVSTATATISAPTGTPLPTATRPNPTPTLAASATATATVDDVDKAEFVADLTVPDGTDFTPGAEFVKTWQVKNTGTTTWTSAYALVFAKGERMGGPDSLPLPGPVAPGQTVDLSLNLTAPQELGAYTGFWQLRSASGAPFGIGALGNEPVYVQIDVVAAIGASPVPTGEAGLLQVSAVSLSVDRPSLTATCPQSLVFTGLITSSGAGGVSYRLEASADTPGFTFDLPGANNAILAGPGPRTFGVSYTLEFRGSVAGQAWLHVLTPNDVTSDKVSFSLTCQAQPGAGG